MGFSTIGSFIILFFALIIMISTFILIQGRLVESTNLAINVQQERLENEVKTSISIVNVSFDNTTSPDTTTTYIKNTGSNKINLDYFDIYIDNIKIPRETNNRTISFAPGSDTINPLHFDPDEIIIIEVYLDLQNVTHIETVMTEYGIGDKITFLG